MSIPAALVGSISLRAERSLSPAKVFIAILAFFISTAVNTANSSPPLSKEALQYRLRFLWFDDVSVARLRFSPLSKGRYRAELAAETKGLAALLTGFQKNRYTSEMKYLPGDNRLVTQRFTKEVSRAFERVKSVTEIDYGSGKMQWVATENGKIESRGSRPVPAGTVYEDLLSALFNLRNGAYGPLVRGRRISVPSLPYYQATDEGRIEYGEEFIESFQIQIPGATKERRLLRQLNWKGGAGVLVLVDVPRRVFGQKSGKVAVWFDQRLTPVAAWAEDVIFFGDVFGTLLRK